MNADCKNMKAVTPVAVLLTSWSMGLSHPVVGEFVKVFVIVIGVVIASFGEFSIPTF